ncbi:MAG: glycosyltransferase family 2 protein, partial [Thermodesulfobacteriota bacterium]
MDVSIVIVSWNTKELLLDCIASVYRTAEKARFEIIVSDNGSRDGSLEAVAEKYPEVRRIENSANLGFARANNIAIERMQGRYALLLNTDTVLKPGAPDRLFDFMESRPDAGMCGPQLLNTDGSRQTSFGTFPTIATEFLGRTVARFLFATPGARPGGSAAPVPDGPAEADFIIGACMMVRRSAMEAVGAFDPDYFFFYEEIDWCWRMRQAGWRIWFVPEAEVVHFGGQSAKNLNLRARAESWRSR